MSDKQDPQEAEIHEEIRKQQKFSMAGAIGRAGGGLMKGESPISQQEQAVILLSQWIHQHTPDTSGALKALLVRRLRDNKPLIDRHLHSPLSALRQMIATILVSDYSVQNFVRQVDVHWGKVYQKRPLFQLPGQAPDPADEYTHESVRSDLTLLLEKLDTSLG